jgi:hypothetical protein
VSSPRFLQFLLYILLVIFHECVKRDIEATAVVAFQNDILPNNGNEARPHGESRLISPASQRILPASILIFLLVGIVFRFVSALSRISAFKRIVAWVCAARDGLGGPHIFAVGIAKAIQWDGCLFTLAPNDHVIAIDANEIPLRGSAGFVGPSSRLRIQRQTEQCHEGDESEKL